MPRIDKDKDKVRKRVEIIDIQTCIKQVLIHCVCVMPQAVSLKHATKRMPSLCSVKYL